MNPRNDSRPSTRFRLSTILLGMVLACAAVLASFIGSFWLSIQRMERLEASVQPDGWLGMTREQFEKRFPDLRGSAVPFGAIPPAFRIRAAALPPGSFVVRYRYLWCDCHIIYDAAGNLKMYIPTYE